MEHFATLPFSNNMDKIKKTISFKSFFEGKRIDKTKIREHFLENCSNIPQELRLVLWKIFLGYLFFLSIVV